MEAAVIDTETTGLDQAAGHRLIEVSVARFGLTLTSPQSLKVRGPMWTTRIQPHRTIDAKAGEVHGITVMDLIGAPEWEVVAPQLLNQLTGIDLLIAHNMGFDGPFVAGELARIGQPVPQLKTFCTMENARWAHALGGLPTLRELCFALGVDYDPTRAHAADYDVDRTLRCFVKGTLRGFFRPDAPSAGTARAA